MASSMMGTRVVMTAPTHGHGALHRARVCRVISAGSSKARTLAMVPSAIKPGRMSGFVALLSAVAVRNPQMFMCVLAPIILGSGCLYFGIKNAFEDDQNLVGSKRV